MFKFVVFFCVIAAAAAGILGTSLRIAAAPAIVSAPTVNLVRTAPIAIGHTIGAPLGVATGVVSHGLVSHGVVSHGLVSGGLVSGGLISGGLAHGGLVSTGKLHI